MDDTPPPAVGLPTEFTALLDDATRIDALLADEGGLDGFVPPPRWVALLALREAAQAMRGAVDEAASHEQPIALPLLTLRALVDSAMVALYPDRLPGLGPVLPPSAASPRAASPRAALS